MIKLYLRVRYYYVLLHFKQCNYAGYADRAELTAWKVSNEPYAESAEDSSGASELVLCLIPFDTKLL